MASVKDCDTINTKTQRSKMSRVQICREPGVLVDWSGRTLDKSILKFVGKGNVVRVPMIVDKDGEKVGISPYFEIVRVCKKQQHLVVGKLLGLYMDSEYMVVGEEKTFQRRDIVEIPLDKYWTNNANLVKHAKYFHGK